MYKHFLKRFLDFWIALIALVCISPLLIVVTLWLHVANKGAGAFFLQERPGKDGRIFRIIKYKTMTDERDADGHLLPDEQRLTRVGRFVRSTSIDELPQLLNVLKGDMAIIGPRPLLVQYLPRCWCSISRSIPRSRPVVMRFVRALLAGHNVTGVMPSRGRRSSNSMYGMSTTYR